MSDVHNDGETRRGFLRHSLMAMGGLTALSLLRTGSSKAAEVTPLLDRPPEGPEDEAYWRKVRDHFQFEPGVSYMNNGGMGLPIPEALDAIYEGYATYSGRGIRAEGDLEDIIRNEVRPQVARLIGAGPWEIALIRNATEGLSAIAHGIDLEAGDEVLMTTHEYPAGRAAWLMKSQRYGVKLREIRVASPPESKEEIVEQFREAITPRTKVITFCHITRGAGLLFPAKELCALAREHGIITAIDGAQSVAQIPVDVKDIGCDLYVTSLHKWALTPGGTGMMYVRRGFTKHFWPLFQGSGPWNEPGAGGRRYEAIGTHELPVRAAIAPTMTFLNRIGLDHIYNHNRMLSDYLKAGLGEIPGVTLATSASSELSGPGITSFQIAGWKAYQVKNLLETEYGIMLSTDSTDGNDLIRVSTHLYNNREDVDRLLTAMKVILKFGKEELAG